MGGGISGSYKGTKGAKKEQEKLDFNPLIPPKLLEELKSKNVKYTEKDIVMIAKQKNGELLWLEKGNIRGGLKHIIIRHENDFKRAFGVSKDKIPSYIKEVIENGEIKSTTLRNRGYERIYIYHEKYYSITGIGTNGYIVSMYPEKRRKKND